MEVTGYSDSNSVMTTEAVMTEVPPNTCSRLLGWLMTKKRKATLLHTPCILERLGGKRRPCRAECVGSY